MEAAIKGLWNLLVSEHKRRSFHQFSKSETFNSGSTLQGFLNSRHKRSYYQNGARVAFVLEKYITSNLELGNNSVKLWNIVFQRWSI